MRSIESFTPAMGRFKSNYLYDPVIRFTRENYWRRRMIEYLAPDVGDIIIDVGCGTGTLLNLIDQIQSQATLIGIDPDNDILNLARAKATKHHRKIIWQQSMGHELQKIYPPEYATKICSSLVLHQCPVVMKKAILQSIYDILQHKGQLIIADFGRQRTLAMRLLFKIVQFADGHQDTQPNADGIIPVLLSELGFAHIEEREVIATAGGSISIYTAQKP